MSVADFIERRRQIFDQIKDMPPIYGIVANSVHGRAENIDLIAVFDTQELADAYVQASLLPEDFTSAMRWIQGKSRSHRPDSLLWDFNSPATAGALPGHLLLDQRLADIVTIPHNPTPPSGPMPPDVFAEDAARMMEAP